MVLGFRAQGFVKETSLKPQREPIEKPSGSSGLQVLVLRVSLLASWGLRDFWALQRLGFRI